MRTLTIFVTLLLVVFAAVGEAGPSNSTQSPAKANATATNPPGTPGSPDEHKRPPGGGKGGDIKDKEGGNHEDKEESPQDDRKDSPNPEATNEEVSENGNPSEDETSVTSGGRIVGGIFGTITLLAYLF